MWSKCAILSCLFIVLIVPIVSAQNIYETQWYTTNDTVASTSIPGLSFKTGNSCNIFLTGHATLNGSSWTMSPTYYSPNTTNPTVVEALTNLQNITCKSLGTAIYNTPDNSIYEGHLIVLDDADEGFYTLRNLYSCSSSSIWINITINRTDSDNFGLVPGRFRRFHAGSPETDNFESYFAEENNTFCETELVAASGDNPATRAQTNPRSWIYYYPFNTTGGVVNYNFDTGNLTQPLIEVQGPGTEVTCLAKVSLVDYETGTAIQLHRDTDFGPTGLACQLDNLGYRGTLNFGGNERNTRKALMFEVGVVTSGVVGATTYNIFEPNLDLAILIHQPNFNCTDFTECDGTTQTRFCFDIDGITPPEIQTKTCSLGVLENATLGFEAFTTATDVMKCQPGWGFAGCIYTLTNISVDRPENWTVVDPAFGKQYFLQMTSEWATEGTRSLKMWYIPPKIGEPITVSTCGNLTQGRIPSITQKASNTSFSVNFNVTFPAENMLIKYDVVKCLNQVKQHGDYNFNLFNINFTTICAQQCYSERCDTSPDGRYFFNIVDGVTDQSIFQAPFFDFGEIIKKTNQFDLTDLNIVSGRNYTISFGVFPENLNDRQGNCVMIDNIEYEVTINPLISLVPDCESRCDGTTRLEARRLTSGSCLVTQTEFAQECLSQEQSTATLNLEDYCLDSTTLNRFINTTRGYESQLCDFLCEDGRCVTEEEIADDPTTTEDPITLLTEFALFVNSPFGWAMIFTGVIFVTAMLSLARMTKDATSAWMGGSISALFSVFFFMALTWIPLEFGALIALILALIVVIEYRKAT